MSWAYFLYLFIRLFVLSFRSFFHSNIYCHSKRKFGRINKIWREKRRREYVQISDEYSTQLRTRLICHSNSVACHFETHFPSLFSICTMYTLARMGLSCVLFSPFYWIARLHRSSNAIVNANKFNEIRIFASFKRQTHRLNVIVAMRSTNNSISNRRRGRKNDCTQIKRARRRTNHNGMNASDLHESRLHHRYSVSSFKMECVGFPIICFQK